MRWRTGALVTVVLVAGLPWFLSAMDPVGATPDPWRTALALWHAGDGEAAARGFRLQVDPVDPVRSAIGRLNAARAEGSAAEGYLEEGADWLLQPAHQCLERARQDLKPLLLDGPWDASEVRRTWARIGALGQALEARLRSGRSAAPSAQQGDPERGSEGGAAAANAPGAGGEGPWQIRVVGVEEAGGGTSPPSTWGTPLSPEDHQRVRAELQRILDERRRRRSGQPLPLGADGGVAW